MGSTAYSTSETWSNAASHYSAQMAEMTSQAADRLITLMGAQIPFDPSDSYVLDNGAGSGNLTTALASHFPGMRVVATDISSAMLAVLDAKRLSNVSTLTMDACVENNEALKTNEFSHVLSTFMTQFTDGPDAALREMKRVLKPNGVIGLGSWIDIAINWPWEEACRELDPTFKPRSPFSDTAWKGEEGIERALRNEGFRDVYSERIKLCLSFDSTEEYVGYWYSAKNPGMLSMQSAWSGDIEEVKGTLEKVLKEKYHGGKEFWLEAVLTTARK